VQRATNTQDSKITQPARPAHTHCTHPSSPTKDTHTQTSSPVSRPLPPHKQTTMSHWRALLQRNCRNVWVWLGSEQNSKGARDFLTNNFAEIRMLNTDYNLMIRHVDGAETELPLPYIEARYHFDPKDKDYRKRARISVRNFSEEEVCKVVSDSIPSQEQ
jgi:hypothetical protein